MDGRMKLSQLKAREIRVKRKAGYGVLYFCEKYDCTEQEFEAKIKQFYSKAEVDGRKILASLRENDANNAKKSTKEAAVAPKTSAKDASEDSPANDESPEETVTVETATLEQLKEMEAMLSNVLMSLESTHKKLAEKHRNCTAKTREQKKKVEEIEVMLQSLKKDYLETTAQDNALIEEMNGISASHYDKTTKIQRVRDRIKELSRILLFVYADGTIAIENSDMVLDESGSDELYRELTEKDECEKLRMKEIRVLARVLKVCSHLPEDTEIVFDNAEIEKAFKILSAS